MSQASRITADLDRLLVESVADYAIFALDPSGRVISWNPGARRFKGYEASEIIGQHFSVFYPEEDLAAGKPEKELEIAASVGRLEDEGWRVRKDGTRFWANVVITALRSPTGDLVGFAKVSRDLTERRAAEQQAVADARRLASEEALRLAAEIRTHELTSLLDQLRSQAVELEDRRLEADLANRTKAEFLAAMSHELRTPLNAIAGYVELLLLGLRGPLSDEQLADLHRIQRSQRYLLNLINDILNLSQLEAGRVTYSMEAVPLPEVLENVASMIVPQAAASHVEFECHACPPNLTVRADSSRTQQVLLNLLSNAVKFTAPGGRVSLRCVPDGQRVLIHVQDTGMGIPADRQAAIFEPFVQLDRSFKSPREGAGLGLAISRDLARGMGGDLTVTSEVGVGSTFTVALRRDDDGRTETCEAPPLDAPRRDPARSAR